MKFKTKHEPTPDEIREACQKLQSTWSDWERMKRAGMIVRALEMPTYMDDGMMFTEGLVESAK